MKTTKQQHTPTPWYLPNGTDKNKFGTYRIAEDSASMKLDGMGGVSLTNIAHVGSLEDAEFIVRAVNSHEALLRATKLALEELNHVSKGVFTSSTQHILIDAIAQAEGK